MIGYLVSGVSDESDDIKEYFIEDLDKAMETAKKLLQMGNSLVSIELNEEEEET